jgi:hypothetical protein
MLRSERLSYHVAPLRAAAMAKSSAEIKELQRSVNRLQQAHGSLLRIGGRAYLVDSEAVLDPEALIGLLARETVAETEAVAGLGKGCRLRAPARAIDGRWLGGLQRDLKLLETHPDLAALTRQAPRLFRRQRVGRDWLAERRSQLARRPIRRERFPDPRHSGTPAGRGGAAVAARSPQPPRRGPHAGAGALAVDLPAASGAGPRRAPAARRSREPLAGAEEEERMRRFWLARALGSNRQVGTGP